MINNKFRFKKFISNNDMQKTKSIDYYKKQMHVLFELYPI